MSIRKAYLLPVKVPKKLRIRAGAEEPAAKKVAEATSSDRFKDCKNGDHIAIGLKLPNEILPEIISFEKIAPFTFVSIFICVIRAGIYKDGTTTTSSASLKS